MKFNYQQRDYGYVHSWSTRVGKYRHGFMFRNRHGGRPSRVKRAQAVMLLRAWAKRVRQHGLRLKKQVRQSGPRLKVIRTRRENLAQMAHGSIQYPS